MSLQANALTICRCKEPDSVKISYEKAISVFSGRVKDVKWKGGEYDRVFFNVSKIWKGKESVEKKILVGHRSLMERLLDATLSCSYMFEEGTEYLLYTYADKRSPEKVSSCGRTKKLAGAKDEIRLLDAIAKEVGK